MGKSDIIFLLVILSVFAGVFFIAIYLFGRTRSSIISKMNKLPNTELPNKEIPNNDEDHGYQKYEGTDIEKYQKEMEKEYKRIEKEQQERWSK